ncbi:hypothetical protein [Tropicibacter naphthalenivorans]|uniref:Uncharacterized protein n=1 Tax=Tropicibacter naphthalenivorans TaxID=441103 RepID=A0A0P1GF04_9RHOB|nr:hypothetical protein [Tropicibacter naphthalenivorans]CUH80058.1 hypothetical protein TRN7648_02777 [Tropicibacter naphthalenivorans]SMC84163.1 hypothetical protein SAMN04488093_10546 [Tropicibacter naphthalenivorans]
MSNSFQDRLARLEQTHAPKAPDPQPQPQPEVAPDLGHARQSSVFTPKIVLGLLAVLLLPATVMGGAVLLSHSLQGGQAVATAEPELLRPQDVKSAEDLMRMNEDMKAGKYSVAQMATMMDREGFDTMARVALQEAGTDQKMIESIMQSVDADKPMGLLADIPDE